MYNDYYLQQINDKVATTNSNLEEIIENQSTIINDNIEIKTKLDNLNNGTTTILFIIAITLVYHFVERCFKC